VNPLKFLKPAVSMLSLIAGFSSCPSVAQDKTPATEAICPVSAESRVGDVRITLVGDIVLGNSFIVNDIPKNWDDTYFSAVRPIFKRSNLLIGNLEGALTDFDKTRKNPGSGKQFAFKMPPRYGKLLANEGFAVLNVANNHANDFGEKGFADTLETLKEAGIAVVGTHGKTHVANASGVKVAVIGLTYSPEQGRLFNSIFDTEGLAAQVRRAKAEGAYTIVTYHAGAEGAAAIWHSDREEMFMGENRGNTVAFSRAMIDAGADLVVGHGPHVLRPVECYKGRPIAYSLGNFVAVGGLSIKQMAAVSAILEVTLGQDGALRKLEMLPVRFEESKVPLPDARGFALHLINRLGKNARYPGKFVEFPAPAESRSAFDAWFAETAPAPR